jgi:hypothetical protein
MMKQTKPKEVNQEMILQALDDAYYKAINGISGFDSAQEMAGDYMKNGVDAISNCNSLIRWQNKIAGTNGFLKSINGLIKIPVAIPVNLASVIYVQLRMVAAIAFIGGHDVKDIRIKALVFLCMAGNNTKELLKDLGIVVDRKLKEQLISHISEEIITAINQKVGLKLLNKFSEKGAINLGKSAPIIGGIIGGTFDSVTTNIIGNTARKTFVEST